MIALRWGAATDVGRRRSNNQDSHLAIDGLFVVADGMGGHAGGEVASLTAVEALRANFKGGTADDLIAAVAVANRAVRERGDADPDLAGMGTTICAVAPLTVDGEDRIAVINIGDSRVYLLRGGELTQLTEDHSLPEELLRAGELTPEQAAVDPRRNVVTRSLGQFDDVTPDVWDLVPYKGDRLLLCSDGLTNEVPDDTIASVLRRVPDPSEAAAELVQLANEGGGRDNITVVIVEVTDDDDAAGRASAALADDPAPMRRASRPLTEEQRNAQTRAPTPPSAPTSGAAASSEEVAAAARRRRFTWRMAAFVVVLLMLAAAAAGAIGWYARGSYFVGLDNDRVTIFQGRPGGFLWFDPTVEDRTSLTESDVVPVRRDAVQAGKETPTLEAARRYVANLREEAATTATTSSTTSTTTTAPTGTQ